MLLLIAGIFLFTGIHMFLSVAPNTVNTVKLRVGAGGLKGLIAVSSAAGLGLIVLGWKSAETRWLYTTPSGVHSAAMGLVVVALYLFVVSNRPAAIKRLIRHPQLTGVLLWATAHLLMNGDSRSLVLFAAMGLWAVLEIVLINRREGAWQKPAAPGLASECITIAIAVSVTAVIVWAHPWLAGVPIVRS